MPALGETARQRRETESGQNPGPGHAVRSLGTPSHPLRIDLRALPCVLFAGTAHYPHCVRATRVIDYPCAFISSVEHSCNDTSMAMRTASSIVSLDRLGKSKSLLTVCSWR